MRLIGCFCSESKWWLEGREKEHNPTLIRLGYDGDHIIDVLNAFNFSMPRLARSQLKQQFDGQRLRELFLKCVDIL